jgi:hypothetical protein
MSRDCNRREQSTKLQADHRFAAVPDHKQIRIIQDKNDRNGGAQMFSVIPSLNIGACL